MNKFVFKKVAELDIQNTELSAHEVELASAKDLLALYGKAVSMANNLLGGIPSKVDELKKVLIDNEKQAVKLIGDLDGALIDYEKVLKELGIDPTKTKNYVDAKKELDALYKGTANITKILQVLK
jgi:hypothetical protein